MESLSWFESLGISVGLGLLVGMQRQRTQSVIAGVRTFALITLLGTLSGLLVEPVGTWIVGVAMGAIALMLVAGRLRQPHAAEIPQGMTTEVAVLVMFAVGVLLVHGPAGVAVAVAGGVTLLLHLKVRMHEFVKSLDEDDVRAIMQFVLVSLVILPVLPDRTFGPAPFDVLNPRQIWWMVVLTVGISLLGYVSYRILGARTGMVLGGLLGGLVSSTATTASGARRFAAGGNRSEAVCVILIASTVLYARLLFEIWIAAPGFLTTAWVPLAVLGGTSGAASLLAFLRAHQEPTESIPMNNPTQLGSSIVFGAIFAGVLLGAAAAKQFLGDRGLYAVAALSGLTDMDAITLSTSRLVESGRLDASAGRTTLVIALMSGLVFKIGISWMMGGRRLAKPIAAYGAAQIAAAGALLLLL